MRYKNKRFLASLTAAGLMLGWAGNTALAALAEDTTADDPPAITEEQIVEEEPAAEPAPDEEQPAPFEEPAAPVEEPAQEDDGVTIPIQSGNDVPNVNPVQDKTEPVKLTEDGKVDPTTIAKAEDFGDWEEETGCRG